MGDNDGPSWGPLAGRFEDAGRPRRLLALDGGGIRGVRRDDEAVRLISLTIRQCQWNSRRSKPTPEAGAKRAWKHS